MNLENEINSKFKLLFELLNKKDQISVNMKCIMKMNRKENWRSKLSRSNMN